MHKLACEVRIMTKTILAIIQARMGSSRFPGKSLFSIGNWSLIELVLKRVSMAKTINKTILATSINPIDDELSERVSQLGYAVSRGSEDDVLSRFYEAAKLYNPNIIVRITGDCPLISPALIDSAVESYADSQVDYLALSIGEDKQLAFPRGFDVEVTSFQALQEAAINAKATYEREHVMPYLYTHPDQFKIRYLEPIPDLSRPRYRICVDTKEDLQVILKIYDGLGEKLLTASYEEIIRFLDSHPEIVKINQSVRQKHFTESDERIR